MSGERKLKRRSGYDPVIVEENIERLAAFIYNLSRRFAQRGFTARIPPDDDPWRYRQYLGLTVETISRLLGRFSRKRWHAGGGKYITISENNACAGGLAGRPQRQQASAKPLMLSSAISLNFLIY